MTRIGLSAIEAVVHIGDKVLGVLVAITLFVMMTVTFADVVGRYFFLRPLPAAYEMTELLMALLIYGAMPLATRRQEHVTISLLDGFFQGRAMQIRTFVVSMLCAATTFCLAYAIWLRSLRLLREGEYTLFLKVQIAPFSFFAFAMAAFMGLCFLLVGIGRVAVSHRAEDGAV